MQLMRIILPVVAALLTLPTLSLAEQVRAIGNAVIINGVSALKIDTSFHGATPDERARLLAAKLEAIPFWGQIDVKSDGSNRIIVVSGEPVLTVTPDEAAAQNATPDSLAVMWSSRIKEALSLPPLKVSDNFVRIPAGGSETVKIIGSAIGGALAETSSPAIAEVTKVGDTIKISGRSVGHTNVSVTAGRAQENIDVEVRPYAANFPQKIDAVVTGAPTTSNTVQGVIEEALKTRLQAASGVRWSFGHILPDPLATGETRTYPVKVWAAAPDAFPSTGTVEVTVKNAALNPYTDDDLWYSNDPETVRQPGSLFSASLKPHGSARLLYHHMNGTMQDMFVRVEAINGSDEAVRMEIIPGDSRPDKDPVRAGVNAADQFMQNWISGSGEVVTIPPQSAMPISLRRLSPGETASGLCSLRQVDGKSGILVRTDAFPPLPLDERWTGALFSSTPWREVGTHPINEFDRAPCEANPHIYPNPYRQDSLDYEVGGRFGFIRIGQRPLERQDDDGVLDGNFGVIYNLKANLSNPTADPTDVEVVFEASAGYSGGLFIVNGSYIKTKLLAPKEVVRIVRYHLAPGATEKLNITTIPISGSSYPATIMVRPITDDSGAAVVHPQALTVTSRHHRA
jgi:hypothetical protein